MLKVINMPAKTGTGAGEESKLDSKKIDKNSVPMNQANAILNKRKDEVEGYKKTAEPKPTTMAG